MKKALQGVILVVGIIGSILAYATMTCPPVWCHILC